MVPRVKGAYNGGAMTNAFGILFVVLVGGSFGLGFVMELRTKQHERVMRRLISGLRYL